MADTRTAPEVEPESQRVIRWRLQELVRADVPLSVAERVAKDPEIEYHAFLTLVKQGCDPGLAFKILRA